jgi:trimeric autotransporter adhesin
MLQHFARTGSLGLGLLLAVQFTAIAQVQPDAAKPAVKVKPHFNVRYSNDGSDFKGRGLGQVETFVPLGQVPGRSVTFGEAKLNLDDHVGGNLRLGYRHYLPGANRIVGGYFGYDHRSTGAANFGQLGLGFETLGDVWDLRLNGYVPLGSTRQQVSRSATDWVTTGTGGLVNTGNMAFRGNALQEIWQQNDRSDRSITTIHQAALGGVELEGGAKLLRFANGGDLRAYAGVYSLSGQGTDSTIGWKLRLAAKPASGLTMGLGVQSDGIFGTNVLFNIGYGWPNALPNGKRDPLADVLARLGDGVERRDRIAVDRQVDYRSETIATTREQLVSLTNPATGQPWFFNHVIAGGAGMGTGTAESPFNGTNIQALLDRTPQDGNGIVYIAKGQGPLAGFTVPGGIQVLSQGPLQQIATEQRGDLQLPNSGQGVGANPSIIGDETVVRVASNPNFKTVLSGFDIQSSVNASSENTLGISISETLGEVQILNNRVSDVDFGIEQRSGSTSNSRLLIEGNQITASNGGIGIMADAVGETPIVLDGNIVLTNNQITAAQQGIAIVAGPTGTLNGDIKIQGNQISAGEFGIIATAIDGGSFNSNLLIDDNTIDLMPSSAESIAGILIELTQPIEGAPSTLGSESIAITNNSITSITGADAGVAILLNGQSFESFPTVDTSVSIEASNNRFSLPFDSTRINQADGVVFGLDQMRFSGDLSIVNNGGSVADDGISYNLTSDSVLDGSISIQGNSITFGSDVVENHEIEGCDLAGGIGTITSDVGVTDGCPP